MKILILLISIICLGSCIKGERQEILIKNKSGGNVYYLIANDITEEDIYKIRPIIVNDLNKNPEKRLVQNKDVLNKYLILKDSVEIIMTSESAGIFLNTITLKSIIRERYSGELNIFILDQEILNNYTDQEIIENGFYDHFLTIREKDILYNNIVYNYY